MDKAHTYVHVATLPRLCYHIDYRRMTTTRGAARATNAANYLNISVPEYAGVYRQKEQNMNTDTPRIIKSSPVGQGGNGVARYRAIFSPVEKQAMRDLAALRVIENRAFRTLRHDDQNERAMITIWQVAQLRRLLVAALDGLK